MNDKDLVQEIKDFVQTEKNYTNEYAVDDIETVEKMADSVYLDYIIRFLNNQTANYSCMARKLSLYLAEKAILENESTQNFCDVDCEDCLYDGNYFGLSCLINHILRDYDRSDIPRYWSDDKFKKMKEDIFNSLPYGDRGTCNTEFKS